MRTRPLKIKPLTGAIDQMKPQCKCSYSRKKEPSPVPRLQGSLFQLVLPAGAETKVNKPQCLVACNYMATLMTPLQSLPSYRAQAKVLLPLTTWGSVLQHGEHPVLLLVGSLCLLFQDFPSPQEAENVLLEAVLTNQINLNQQPENQLKISSHSLQCTDTGIALNSTTPWSWGFLSAKTVTKMAALFTKPWQWNILTRWKHFCLAFH